VSALEVMQDANATFTMDELYALLRSFEEKLKQADDYQQNTKYVVFSALDFTNKYLSKVLKFLSLK
jgi:hypothetical protein